MLTERHTKNFYDKAANEHRDFMFPEKARWCINPKGSL